MTDRASKHAPASRLPQLAVAVGFAIFVILAIGSVALWNMASSLETLEAQNLDLSTEIADLSDRVAAAEQATAEQVASLAPAGQAASPADEPATAVPAPPTARLATSLPPLPSGGADPAEGMLLGGFGGTEYYTSSDIQYNPADGKARAIFIWAHWCPYCQQEMPIVQSWVTEKAAEYENMELLSVTTSIDPSRSNPLEPYLDEGQYDFPILVDPDGSLAAHFGVTAFPFWVFTGPDGTVLARIAGLLPEEQIVSIFDQLEALGAEA